MRTAEAWCEAAGQGRSKSATQLSPLTHWELVLQGIVTGVMTFWMRLRHQLKHPTPTTEIEFPILYLRVFMIYFW